ncbi:MAG: hypothetical protein KHZ15_00835 [Coprobacillus cateniformis]|uniref:DUF6440 family protein n=1 Tax=Longibaculum muris TaxID=1796628 RepID=UPI003AB215D7|nr:hypothetical protein [Coprobacillus cateniformis]
MSKKENRFVTSYEQKTFSTEIEILVDKETGVNYLFHQFGNGGGLTVLVDREGRPIITTVFPEEE